MIFGRLPLQGKQEPLKTYECVESARYRFVALSLTSYTSVHISKETGVVWANQKPNFQS